MHIQKTLTFAAIALFLTFAPKALALPNTPECEEYANYARTAGAVGTLGPLTELYNVCMNSEAGHFETDTMFCLGNGVNVIAERAARKVWITKLSERDAASTTEVILNRLRNESAKSITADNGPENAEHALIAAILDLQFYFCHPYHSWEKGTVENRNGVIRRYLPRNTDLNTWTQTELDEIAEDINTTPMKCLRYRTPNEVYSELRCTRN